VVEWFKGSVAMHSSKPTQKQAESQKFILSLSSSSVTSSIVTGQYSINLIKINFFQPQCCGVKEEFKLFASIQFPSIQKFYPIFEKAFKRLLF
jgi:hypothetical protein